MEEPSVLDYIKSLLTPWKRTRIEIPASITGEAELAEEPLQEPQPVVPETKEVEPEAVAEPRASFAFPWRALLALSLALAAQWSSIRFQTYGSIPKQYGPTARNLQSIPVPVNLVNIKAVRLVR